MKMAERVFSGSSCTSRRVLLWLPPSSAARINFSGASVRAERLTDPLTGGRRVITEPGFLSEVRPSVLLHV